MICKECGKYFNHRRRSAKYCRAECCKKHWRPTADYQKKYRQSTIEERKAYDRLYYKKHCDGRTEKNKAYKAKWNEEHPERRCATEHKRRTAKTKAGGSYTSAQWIALCNKYGNKCLCCDKKRKLTADHIVPVSKGGTSNISNIQPLCGPCNSSKGAKTVDYRRETNNAGHSSRSNRSKC